MLSNNIQTKTAVVDVTQQICRSDSLDSAKMDKKLSASSNCSTSKEANDEKTPTSPLTPRKKSLSNSNGSIPKPTEAVNSSSSFVSNVKQFIRKRFSSTNLNDYDSNESSLANSSNKLELESEFNNLVLNSLSESDPIKRYKQILEDHKDLLPKDFTIRNFPFSSCSNTFDDGANNKPIIREEQLEKGAKSGPNEDEKGQSNEVNDECNAANKRFYHVFKKNELNQLIVDNCPNLLIYDTYYDHGNWCCVGTKIEPTNGT